MGVSDEYALKRASSFINANQVQEVNIKSISIERFSSAYSLIQLKNNYSDYSKVSFEDVFISSQEKSHEEAAPIFNMDNAMAANSSFVAGRISHRFFRLKGEWIRSLEKHLLDL
mgnify:CR=1 FL=1